MRPVKKKKKSRSRKRERESGRETAGETEKVTERGTKRVTESESVRVRTGCRTDAAQVKPPMKCKQTAEQKTNEVARCDGKESERGREEERGRERERERERSTFCGRQPALLCRTGEEWMESGCAWSECDCAQRCQ